MSIVNKISWEELDKIRFKANVVLMDIRNQREYLEGHIEPAIHVDCEKLELKSTMAVRDYMKNRNLDLQDKTVVVYCDSGGRSVYFAKHLLECGYQAYSLSGGYRAYKKYIVQKFKYI